MSGWQVVSIVGSLVVGAIGAVAGIVFSIQTQRRADKVEGDRRATEKAKTDTETIRMGVVDLVGQYREANEELRDEVHECRGACDALRDELGQVRAEMQVMRDAYDRMETTLDDREAEIIRLKQKAGEPL